MRHLPVVSLVLCTAPLIQGLHLRQSTGYEGKLGEPSLYQSPRFRWWWPGGWIEADQVVDEFTSIIEAGFGGGEIGDVRDSITEPSDPKVYGWAQAQWNAGVSAAYKQANKLGGFVDLTLGPHWPTGYPGYTPDSKETMKELVHGQAFVKAGKTYDGTLPLPVASPSGNLTTNIVTATPKLVAVLAAEVNTTDESASVVGFSAKTLIDITKTVTKNNTITWTAPQSGSYVIVAIYARGTGQVQNMYDMNANGPELTYPSPAYIVDHFSIHGFDAGAKYWDEHILTSELRAALAKNGGSFFEDSLELKYKQYWTLNLIDEFKSRRGYDLTPFLLYLLKDTNTYSGDSKVAAQVTNDFYQTVTDLYMDYRLKPLQKWANKLGMKLRIQPYTASFDSSYASSYVDIPEGESLGFESTPDSFRVLATGRDVAGKQTILSDEIGAYMGRAYGVTWRFLLGTANHDMSLGVSQLVIHGFPYETSQTSLWPGYAPFTPLGTSSNGFADAWGPRQPQWVHAKTASTYLSNAQKLLQESGSSIDVAILNEDWGVTASWDDTSLNAAGYSYQFPTPNLLSNYNVKVRNGRLAPNGPAYKALVVNNTAMDVKTAKLILSYGKSGLPIVFVGSLPQQTFGYASDASEKEKNLSSVLSQIQALKTTASASDTSGVPAALVKLGVSPSVRYSSSANGNITTLRRTVDSGYLYWIYNNGAESFTGTVQLEGESQPLQIDLYTGTVSPIPAFQTASGYTSLNVTLGSEATVAIYLGSKNPFGATNLKTTIASTDCSSYVRGSSVFIASSSSCTAKISNGKSIHFSAPEGLPAAVSSFSWKLSVQDWAPADVNETGADSYKTTKTDLAAITLSELAAWPKIGGLEDASGIGNYTTTFSASKNATNTRVLLNIGDVEGSWAVKVNGKTVSDIDWFVSKSIDITDLVQSGENDLEINVATTLWNKLRTTWPAIYGSLDAQDVGLLGPVTITHVAEQEVN